MVSETEKRPLPRSATEVELTPALRKLLDDSAPGGWERLDYRLRFLAEMRACLGDEVTSRGYAVIDLTFDYDEARAVGFGGAVEVIEAGGFSAGEEDAYERCAATAHVGNEFDYEALFPGEPRPFHVFMNVAHPIENSFVYAVIRYDGDTEKAIEVSRLQY